MIKPKAAPVVGGIVGLIALVALAVQLASPGASTAALQRSVDEFFDRERQESPQTRHQDLAKRLDELQALQNDPHFGEIPGPKQDLVQKRVRELTLYNDFAAAVDHLADPQAVENEEQLASLRKQADLIKVPDEYRPEWEQTEAGRRWRMTRDDIKAIETAAEDAKKQSRLATEEAEAVLRDRNAPRLPQRAKAALDRGSQLPAKDMRLPGSERLTYAVVYRFPTVVDATRGWEKARDRLKPLVVE